MNNNNSSEWKILSLYCQNCVKVLTGCQDSSGMTKIQLSFWGEYIYRAISARSAL